MSALPSVQELHEDLQSGTSLLSRGRRRRAMERLEARREEPEVVAILVGALGHKDAEIQHRAAAALRQLKSAEGRDALCANAGQAEVARLCLEAGVRPSTREADVLFLITTGQFERYFEPGEYGADDFQTLRRACQEADEATRRRVREVIDEADPRWQPFLARPRKALAECTAEEIETALAAARRRREWERVFRAFLELPLKFGFPLLEPLRRSGWQAATPELKQVFNQVMQDSQGQHLSASGKARPGSAVFERWLARGCEAGVASRTEEELLQELAGAAPPVGVALVAALATKSTVSPQAVRAVATSEHWLIRLAGAVSGLTRGTGNPGPEGIHWARELAVADDVMELWPARVAAAQREALAKVATGVGSGESTAARKILHTLAGYWLEAGARGRLAIEVDGETAELVEAVAAAGGDLPPA